MSSVPSGARQSLTSTPAAPLASSAQEALARTFSAWPWGCRPDNARRFAHELKILLAYHATVHDPDPVGFAVLGFHDLTIFRVVVTSHGCRRKSQRPRVSPLSLQPGRYRPVDNQDGCHGCNPLGLGIAFGRSFKVGRGDVIEQKIKGTAE